jgi:hypothetical protein
MCLGKNYFVKIIASTARASTYFIVIVKAGYNRFI